MRFLWFVLLAIIAYVSAGENDRYLSLPNPEKCKARTKEFQYDGRNYFYSGNDKELKDAKYDWLDSRNACRDRCMETVSFETQAEFEFIKAYIEKNNIKFIWTSGRLCDFSGCEGRWDLLPKIMKGWLWSANQIQIDDTSKIPNGWTYTPWSFNGTKNRRQPDNAEFYINQATESCIGVLNNQYNDSVSWHDIACYHKTGFICEDSPELLLEVQEAKSGSDRNEEIVEIAPKKLETTPLDTTTPKNRPSTTARAPASQKQVTTTTRQTTARQTTPTTRLFTTQKATSKKTTVEETTAEQTTSKQTTTEKITTTTEEVELPIFSTTITSRFRAARTKPTTVEEFVTQTTRAARKFRTRKPTEAETTRPRTTVSTTTEEVVATKTSEAPQVEEKFEEKSEKLDEIQPENVDEPVTVAFVEEEKSAVKTDVQEEPVVISTSEEPFYSTSKFASFKRKQISIEPIVKTESSTTEEAITTKKYSFKRKKIYKLKSRTTTTTEEPIEIPSTDSAPIPEEPQENISESSVSNDDIADLQQIEEITTRRLRTTTTTTEEPDTTRAIPIRRKNVKLYKKVIKFKPSSDNGPSQRIDDNSEYAATIAPPIVIRKTYFFKPKFRPSRLRFLSNSS